MKTTGLMAILVAASAFLFIQPVFAQADHDSPSEIGSGAWGSTDPVYSDEPNASSPYGLPSYDESFAGYPALAPAPEQPAESDPGSMYVPPAPYGLVEVPGHPPISPTSPELIPPDSFARPAGSFGYDGRIH